MNGFWTVCKRELKGYFFTPVAYVFLVIFLFFAGYLPFKDRFFEIRQADLRLFFQWIPVLFVFMVPSTAMRLWSEERKTGSIEMLLSLPITTTQAVLGKFVAAWIFLGIALLLTFPFPMTVFYLGEPDLGPIVTGYLGSFLMAGAYLAVGCFFSALTKNQVISFILAVVTCAVLFSIGLPTTVDYLSNVLPESLLVAVENLSFQTHFESMQKGIVAFKDMSYFILMIVGWVWACCIILEERKSA
jgi:ABC-2 type transport system permease protein